MTSLIYSPVGGIQAKFTAFINTGHVLVHGVNGLQNTSGQALEFAQFVGLLSAVVLQIVNAYKVTFEMHIKHSFDGCLAEICYFTFI